MPAYRSLERKAADALAYRRDEAVPWTVLVDDLQGTVHQVYGGLSNPAYLIGVDGRVSYYGVTTGAPTLHTAIARLLDRGGVGVVTPGMDLLPHLLPVVTDGWRGLARGRPQSTRELMAVLPPSVPLLRFGDWLRPLLAPLTLRARPLPTPAQAGLVAAAAVPAVLAAYRRRARRSR